MNPLINLVSSALKNNMPGLREDTSIEIEKIDESLNPNMRALKLAMTVAEYLVSMDMGASDATHLALGITKTYCTRPVHIDISYTLIILSQYRGIDHEPLTMSRTVHSKETSQRTVQDLEILAKDIAARKITLSRAEKILDKIVNDYRPQERHVSYLSSGLVSVGVSVMYDASPIILLTSFIMGISAAWVIHKMDLLKLPTFFTQAIVAILVVLSAAALTYGISTPLLDFLWEVNTTILIISGIVLLAAGMMIVSAFQDAIDEYYVTASARILKVIMMTGGIVLGATLGLYVANQFHIDLSATPDKLASTTMTYQLFGAMIIGCSFALSRNAKLTGVISSGFIALIGLSTFNVLTNYSVDSIAASGISATLIGFLSTIISRLWRVPTISTISAGIVPLVPGLSLYSGLLFLTQSSSQSNEYSEGILLLTNALMVAITIAAGASFGNILGRPLRRKSTREANSIPQ